MGLIQPQLLGNVRVRHSMLLGAYIQTKNYLDCVERGYLGEMEEFEKNLVEELKKNTILIENVLWDYFDREADILD